MGGTAGDPDGQNFALGTSSKDQRANKDALLKMTRNKRQTSTTTAPAAAAKTSGTQQTM